MMPTTAHSRKTWAIALFAGILLAMRIGVARSGIAASLDGQLRPALLSFALLLAPLWFFGFGLGEWLAQRLRSPWSRVAFPALLGVPYLVVEVQQETQRRERASQAARGRPRATKASRAASPTTHPVRSRRTTAAQARAQS